MGFSNFGQIKSSWDEGRHTLFTWRKTPAQTTGAGIWFDLSMSLGVPSPNYYASSPATAALLTAQGLNVGGNVSPYSKHLMSLMAMTTTAAATPLVLILCDYVLYYPFMDMSDTSEQTMDNTVTVPRYTSSGGLQIIAVEVAAMVGGATFIINYTNDQGVSGRTTPTITCNTQTAVGTLVNTDRAVATMAGPFIRLQGTDTGVQKIDSVTFLTPDTGLLTFVLVKPIATMTIRSIDAPVEVNYLKDFSQLPLISDGSYLNFLALPNGTLSGAPIHGIIESVWSS